MRGIGERLRHIGMEKPDKDTGGIYPTCTRRERLDCLGTNGFREDGCFRSSHNPVAPDRGREEEVRWGVLRLRAVAHEGVSYSNF
ncbi:unnamed protein product [Linum tenue]|uniref:Uncharacterized protein n=1 Tax=Linum tenue TaxID=586396 RepID=A0AAV0MVY1_9ROSI|nr:unnamed protein product [Linum tenue]